MSWELWLAAYFVIGVIWAVLEQLAYDDYYQFEFFLCVFLWLPRLVVWGCLLIYLGTDKLWDKVFDWGNRWRT